MLTRPREIYLATAVSIGILLSLIAPLGPPLARADGTSQLAELVDAAAERLEVADPVAAFKWRAQLPIEDSGRVEQQLAKLGEDARSQHIDPDYVTRVFDDQIRATEAIEYSLGLEAQPGQRAPGAAGSIGIAIGDRLPE